MTDITRAFTACKHGKVVYASMIAAHRWAVIDPRWPLCTMQIADCGGIHIHWVDDKPKAAKK